jgi:hypothetical protein
MICFLVRQSIVDRFCFSSCSDSQFKTKLKSFFTKMASPLYLSVNESVTNFVNTFDNTKLGSKFLYS